MNTNIDQFGIPQKGFIQADKIRRAQQTSLNSGSSANWLPREKGAPSRSGLSSFIPSKSAMIAVATLLAMTAIVAFLVGENRVLSTAAEGHPDSSIAQKTEITRQEIVALQSEIELEKLKITREKMHSDVAADSPSSVVEFNVDDQTLSMSDPVSGQVYETLDPEIQAMRDRTLSMIEAQNRAVSSKP